MVAEAASEGLDFAAALAHARGVGGPALRAMTFHERAAMLRALGKRLLDFKPEFYALSHATGATRGDSWIDIDGGIGTMLVFASKGARELPDGHVYLDGAVEPLSKGGSFVGQHICVPLEGAAVHINAFNFPVWGMLEKLAPALLAGVPAIVKPATSTSYLTELVVRRIVETGLLPAGRAAAHLRRRRRPVRASRLPGRRLVHRLGGDRGAGCARIRPSSAHAVRFVAETDSLNSSILGPDAGPGTPEFELFVQRSRARDDGQGRAEVHGDPQGRRAASHGSATWSSALQAKLAKTVVGDPRTPGVGMGPLASARPARRGARATSPSSSASRSASRATPSASRSAAPIGAQGAFLPPILLLCRDACAARAVHAVEAFGPVSTVIGYDGVPDAIALARRGDGSLVGSVFTADDEVARRDSCSGSRRITGACWS